MSVRSPAVAEFHVPIAPTPGFFTRVRLLAASLRRFGGRLADSPIVVTVSRDCEPYDIAATLPWAAEHPIEWRWVDAGLYERFGIDATALARFTYDYAAPLVVQLDADTIVAAPLDELLDLPQDTLGGVITERPPDSEAVEFTDGIARTGEAFWRELHLLSGLPPQPLECQYSGWDLIDFEPATRFCPPYYNLGVLAASAAVTRRIGAVIFDELAAVKRFAETRFRSQLALSLALARTGTPSLDLHQRWNFPDDPRYWHAHPDDAADVRILHYCWGADGFDRAADTESLDAVEAFLGREGVAPAHALLQTRLRAALTPPATGMTAAPLGRDELLALGVAAVGDNVAVDRSARILGAGNLRIGSHVRIDAFAVISAGEGGIVIGDHVHVGAHAFLSGSGRIELADFSGLSGRVSIYSSSDDYSGEWLTNPTVPEAFTGVTSAPVRVGRHAILGAGAVVLPGVEVGDGAAVGALSLVRRDVAEFTVVAGTPARPVAERSRRVLELERRLRDEESA
jgi:acetyltransferase-like isoleucine patch superfamily enzyme